VSGVTWLEATTAADYAATTKDMVIKAARLNEAQPGSLHGYQRVEPNGKWRFHPDCLDAWVRGEVCEHRNGNPPYRIRTPG
jgi:hypothetical protein